MKENIYNYFEIEKTANQDEIKKAYRKKSKKVHPDLGGSKEDFEKTNKYYKLLINSKLKEIYDKTGEILGEKDISFNFLDTVVRIFEETLFVSSDTNHSNYKIENYKIDNVILKMKQNILKEIDTFKEEKKRAVISNTGLKDILKRISSKKENIFKKIIQEKINLNEVAETEIKAKIKNHNEALEFLEDYNYETDSQSFVEFSSVLYQS